MLKIKAENRPLPEKRGQRDKGIRLPVSYGIKAAGYQGDIDWKKVGRNAGFLRFVFVHYGYGLANGNVCVDAAFLHNIVGVYQAGLEAGVWLDAYFTTQTAARSSILKMCEGLTGLTVPITYPVVIGFHEKQYCSRRLRASNTAILKTALDTLREKGCYAMFHTSQAFLSAYLDSEELYDYPLWSADTIPRLPGTLTRPCEIHTQSKRVRIDGIQGKLRLNACCADYSRIISSAGLNHLS